MDEAKALLDLTLIFVPLLVRQSGLCLLSAIAEFSRWKCIFCQSSYMSVFFCPSNGNNDFSDGEQFHSVLLPADKK
ncbi:hypothetical protein K7X08_011746 [Anisodus acutangulus]|uniref:Uncharacterized protein n=1 Tax=Anisodus acutangulus TaxID=402998 RepID=A0A9Q1MK53_9SOLA|nr:hypothetical protein K7X08_011746 [Anisodus acutangulus]